MADYDHRYAGSGTKGLAITGTVLGGAALLGKGLFGGRGLFGRGYAPAHGHGGGCECDKRGPMVDRFELQQSQVIAAQNAEIALLRAEKDTQRKFGIVETQIAHLQDSVCCLKQELHQANQRISQITATVIPSTVVWTPPAQVTTPEGGGTTVT